MTRLAPFELHLARPRSRRRRGCWSSSQTTGSRTPAALEVLLLMKLGLASFGQLADVKRIPELSGVAVDESGTLRIGATTPIADRPFAHGPPRLAGARRHREPGGQHPSPDGARSAATCASPTRTPTPRPGPGGRRPGRARHGGGASDDARGRVPGRPVADGARSGRAAAGRRGAAPARWLRHGHPGSRPTSDPPRPSLPRAGGRWVVVAEARVAVGSVGPRYARAPMAEAMLVGPPSRTRTP
ncbi:MAG: hypothetical protein R3C32_02470 [Chloroflexota bacterium]